ncbi:MAG: hypothetical protein LBS24_00020 [Clostridiales Family XIII bacterium]|jgi:hypothetical protein|nr:hypothetical protein [Clostridiales Family XIII bacterium]
MNNTEFCIDERDAAEIRAQIKALAASYTPEWIFGEQNPDVGSVIAMIFAKQTEGNILRLNRVLEKLHTEFVNLLALSPQPAQPAHGAVVFSLAADTVAGVDLPKGVKLLGHSEDEEIPIIFETDSDLHVTDAKLRDILLVSPATGKILSIMGAARRVSLFGRDDPDEEDLSGEEAIPPFRLFDASGPDIGRNTLVFYHRNLFDMTAGGTIAAHVKCADAEDEAHFCDPARYRWSYTAHDGLRPFARVAERDGAIWLTSDEDTVQVNRRGESFSAVVLEAVDPIRKKTDIETVGFSSFCESVPPDFVTHNTSDTDVGAFMPFGDTASIFDECYIGSDGVFGKQGAAVGLRFLLSYREKLVSFSPEEEIVNLKVIKRKSRSVAFDTAHTAVERVAFEYFNGTGWRRIALAHDMSALFAGETAGEISIEFTCPSDWAPLTVGGYTGRCLRLRVAQADNCYIQPCVHKMPLLKQLSFSYHYPDGCRAPDIAERISGTQVTDLTESVHKQHPFAAFLPMPHAHNELYLGFDRRFTGAPVSLLLDIERNARLGRSPLLLEYSSPSGFKPLNAADNIGDLTGPGMIRFIPPVDLSEREVEGVKRFWLRISDKNGSFDAPESFKPLVRNILLNAAQVLNAETLPTEPYYIDAVRPGMSFKLPAGDILSADVFVNELGLHTKAVMRRMAAENPSDVRISHNTSGEIGEFFVRWKEVENFDLSKPTDRHYRIDRMENTLHFGDGISVMIPRANANEAFTVTLRCCRGNAGNLPTGAISEPMGSLLHIDGVTNPLPTWAGGNMENSERMHARSANILCSQNRLRSVQDFLREARLYAENVVCAACAAGADRYGRRDTGRITVAVLTRDYNKGTHSFANIKEGLEARILGKCDATISRDMLSVTEPVYVMLSVSVFAGISDEREAFTVQKTITDALADFLSPIAKDGSANWEIGLLPDEVQIRLLLNSLHVPASIRRVVTSARYADDKGFREQNLSDIRTGPFMIGVNGRHAVHLVRT